ncbi:MAG: ATP synthase F1 subunit gamma [Planctomycetes bacterium]|jgi:F-type H+-transporting ATPase subunit gamma|nr:ATP synthase F1 subunit gamma [Planctomycetota bacterium]
MANPRLLDKRRKSIKNIRKITRTMELIATARFKKAMDRAFAATAYTDRITKLVHDLLATGMEVDHPLLKERETVSNATLLVLTANRGLCGGFNGNMQRAAYQRWLELNNDAPNCRLEISGKRGISALKFRGIKADVAFTHFEDKPAFDEVDVIAHRYLEEYATGRLDRLDIVYTKFSSVSRQEATIETLLPLSAIGVAPGKPAYAADGRQSLYEFLPSPASILEEVVPTSFKIKLFKCFLDSAVSEQIARMVAMKSATENADDLIRRLSMQYNRARQGRITSELMDVIGGVEALS